MIIRKATLTDVPTIVDFQIAMAQETENLPLHKPTVESGVKHIFDEPCKGVYYVAEIDGNVVASMLTTFEWSDWRNKTIIWLQSVYVKQEHRRKGVFSKMYAHIRQLVIDSNQYAGIRLYVHKSNINAQIVYQTLGLDGENYALFENVKL